MADRKDTLNGRLDPVRVAAVVVLLPASLAQVIRRLSDKKIWLLFKVAEERSNTIIRL